MVDLARIAAQTVDYYRALDEGATVRRHFRHVDEEEGHWYLEAVPDQGEWVVVKQAELTSAVRSTAMTGTAWRTGTAA